jgi:hypothetical protein
MPQVIAMRPVEQSDSCQSVGFIATPNHASKAASAEKIGSRAGTMTTSANAAHSVAFEQVNTDKPASVLFHGLPASRSP